MRIVTASDAAFLPGVVALAKSLMRFPRSASWRALDVLWVGPAGAGPDWDWVTSYCNLWPMVIDESLPIRAVLGPAAWARYSVPWLFQHDERVLYLDSDIVCTGPIDALENLDLEGHPTAACVDGGLSTIAVQTFGHVPRDEPALNSGVLLIDVEAWRKDEIARKTFDVIKIIVVMGRNQSWDQAALSVVHMGGFKQLDRRFNFLVLPRVEPPGSGEASLVHFVGRPKPWEDSSRPGAAFWRAEYEREV